MKKVLTKQHFAVTRCCNNPLATAGAASCAQCCSLGVTAAAPGHEQGCSWDRHCSSGTAQLSAGPALPPLPPGHGGHVWWEKHPRPQVAAAPLWLQWGCYSHHRNNKDFIFFSPVGVFWPPLESESSCSPSSTLGLCRAPAPCLVGRTQQEKRGCPPKPDLEGLSPAWKSPWAEGFLSIGCLWEQNWGCPHPSTTGSHNPLSLSPTAP